ncbi:MAG TPA: hypothetical protein VES42_04115 [Pilimelia sp.]|nr:hypothetical protein [Pilimelia sp.]
MVGSYVSVALESDQPGITRRRLLWVRVVVGVLALVVSVGMAVVARQAPAQADAARIGGDFVPLTTPWAVLDTRTGIGGVTGVRGPASTTSVEVLGAGGVPAEEVSAVLIDVSTVSPTANTYLTLTGDGSPWPGVSMLNVKAGEVLSNSAAVPVGANGKIAVYNSAGTTHIVIDVQGYFTATPGGLGGGFVPVNHTRLVDTPTGLGGAAIAAGTARTFTLTGGVIPAGASAVFLDFVVSGARVRSWLSAYPADGSYTRATIDFLPGTTSHGASVRLSADGRTRPMTPQEFIDGFLNLPWERVPGRKK